MENVGRNDPCPCGSGKKYKKCHGETTNNAPIDLWKRAIQMDQKLMTALAKHGAQRFADKGFDPFFLEPEEEAHTHDENCDHDHDEVMFADVSFPLALFTDPRFPVVASYLEAKGSYLSSDEKVWLDAQAKAQFSLWQLVGLGEEHKVTLKDRLTDKEVIVVDGDLQQEGKKGDLMLARMVGDVLTGMHPEIVEQRDADEAVAHVQKIIAESPDKSAYGSQLALVDAWHDVVYGEDEDEEAAE